jgi:FkbM family methyltransferase
MELARPEYLLQPSAIVRRLRAPYALPGQGTTRMATPAWGGLPVEARSDESVGYLLQTTGVFDIAVTEALFRLAEPGELALDVGANIGAMTSALATAVGPSGEVWAFEPSPAVLPGLQRSVEGWGRNVTVFPLALSDRAGEARFVIPTSEAANHGRSRIGSDAEDTEAVTVVETERLDALLDERRVGVMKLDAERHEPAVLAGAARMLGARRVRDIIYEDVSGFPSPTSAPLVEAGYEVFALGHSFFGPRLDPHGRVTAGWEEQSYLATVDPARARRLLKPRGWRCLSRMR